MDRPFRSFSDMVGDAIGPVSGKTILDIGCGEGAKCRELAAMGAEVTGVEPNTDAIATARHAGGGPRYEVAGADKIPFPDGAFDVAIFTDSLHHIPCRAEALAEAARVVGVRGAILVLEPEADDPSYPVFRLLDDEKQVYEDAQAAIDAGAAKGLFARADTRRFASKFRVATFDQVLDIMRDVDPDRQFDPNNVEEARRLFPLHIEEDAKGRFFTCWARLDILKRA